MVKVRVILPASNRVSYITESEVEAGLLSGFGLHLT